MRPLTAVIFDLDGVLIDSEPLHAQAWEALFAEIGYARTHGMIYHDYLGVSDRIFLDDFLAKHRLSHSPAELHARKLQHLYRFIREQHPIDPLLRTLVPDLAKHFLLGVASSSNQEVIDVVLDVAGLRSYFKTTVGGNAVKHHKPDPEVYQTAIHNLGQRSADCCAIEDSPTGIRAAKAAGLTAIGLTTSATAEKLHEADYIAHNFIDIRRLLL